MNDAHDRCCVTRIITVFIIIIIMIIIMIIMIIIIIIMIKPEECPESASSWWEASQGLPSMTRNVS